MGRGGGQADPCEAKFIEKCPCSHHFHSALITQISFLILVLLQLLLFRMTVVAKKKGSQSFSVFVKGAPEKVASFCRPETGRDRERERERETPT